MEIGDVFIEVFFGTVGSFNFESIEGFSVNDAFDFFLAVDDREIGEAGFVKLVEDEGPEKFFFIDEDHFFFRNHEVFDGAVIEAHDGGDAVAILRAKNGMRGTFQEVDKFGEALRGGKLFSFFVSRFRTTRRMVRAIFFKLWVKKTDKFLHKCFEHDTIDYITKGVI